MINKNGILPIHVRRSRQRDLRRRLLLATVDALAPGDPLLQIRVGDDRIILEWSDNA